MNIHQFEREIEHYPLNTKISLLLNKERFNIVDFNNVSLETDTFKGKLRSVAVLDVRAVESEWTDTSLLEFVKEVCTFLATEGSDDAVIGIDISYEGSFFLNQIDEHIAKDGSVQLNFHIKGK